MLLGLSIFSVFFSHVIGFAGAGGLCTLVLAFLAALSWKTDKVRSHPDPINPFHTLSCLCII